MGIRWEECENLGLKSRSRLEQRLDHQQEFGLRTQPSGVQSPHDALRVIPNEVFGRHRTEQTRSWPNVLLHYALNPVWLPLR